MQNAINITAVGNILILGGSKEGVGNSTGVSFNA